MSNRVKDINGFWEVKDNPISKIGVFPYSGAQIGHADKDRIFMVYRSAEELGSQETIDSFKLQPWINGHVMLGSEESGRTPAEKKGIGGVIGEQVHFDGEYLRGNIKIFSEAHKAAIDNGAGELSAGFHCKYLMDDGIFQGQPFQVRQVMIRGNHLASVEEGRCGADVAVMDSMTFAMDSNQLEYSPMADTPEETGSASLDQLPALLEQLVPIMAALQKVVPGAPVDPVVEEPVVESVDEEDLTATADEEGEKPVDGEGMDAKLMAREIRSLKAQIKALSAKPAEAMDAKAFATQMADRDQLARELSGFVGTFDHARMDLAGVAAYGCEKLGLKAPKGAELTAVKGYLHGRTAPHLLPAAQGMDSAQGTSILDSWGK